MKKRLQDISERESEQLLSRLNRIENTVDKNITELEDIYADYEVLYRKDLIENLYIPKEDITIIDNYQDIKPQLIHHLLELLE